MPNLLTDREVAKHLNISKASVWRWLDEGRLPKPLKLSPGCTRWRADEIAAFIEAATQAT